MLPSQCICSAELATRTGIEAADKKTPFSLTTRPRILTILCVLGSVFMHVTRVKFGTPSWEERERPIVLWYVVFCLVECHLCDCWILLWRPCWWPSDPFHLPFSWNHSSSEKTTRKGQFFFDEISTLQTSVLHNDHQCVCQMKPGCSKITFNSQH